MATLPIVNLDVFLADPSSTEAKQEAAKTLQALVEYGALIVKDSRVREADNDAFLDVMEDYFSQPSALLKADERPEYHYQVGVTLENTEKPKCGTDAGCQQFIASLAESERPLDMQGGHADPKCRFFHRMGTAPPKTTFPSLAMENVIPPAFAETWTRDLEAWGTPIALSVQGVTRMLGAGLGIGDKLSDAALYGNHLLAPTATDLSRFGKEGEIFAGVHTDLNFLTIHGRSRFPGLHVWARNSGKKIAVKLPPGHLLVQAGKQLEHLTGGLILAGFHEVVCTKATVEAMASRKANPATANRPLNRISSTFFYHLSSDELLDASKFLKTIQIAPTEGKDLSPAVKEAEKRALESKYEAMMVGTLVQNELKHIALMA